MTAPNQAASALGQRMGGGMPPQGAPSQAPQQGGNPQQMIGQVLTMLFQLSKAMPDKAEDFRAIGQKLMEMGGFQGQQQPNQAGGAGIISNKAGVPQIPAEA